MPRDFVEYPSQVNEMWLEDPRGPRPLRPPPRDRRAAAPPRWSPGSRKPRRFGEGFATTEYLAAALLDQAWHRLGADAAVDDVAGVRGRRALPGIDVPSVPPRYRTTYFTHIFGGGYSAGYYSYIWSEVLDADTVEWFTENGGLHRENGERFRRGLLAHGRRRRPDGGLPGFRGRGPDVTPLLVRRGLRG